ncbi:MAG: cation transporter [Planctomycetes bacterium]|nr:cation transporter [Planctomycetota bacterium]
MKPVTIESLVIAAARARVGRTDGFRFCAEPSCEVAYFHPETGDRLLRSDVKVRIGQKETAPSRPVCYCFDHTVEEIEDEVARTGSSRIPDQIQEKCREGLDRCEETNPQGACCLGNVRRTLKEAQAQVNRGAPVPLALTQESDEMEEDCCAVNTKHPSPSTSRLDAGVVAQFGALASAMVASACCWLPLLLIAVGVSGGALAATFEAWRPVLLPVTFVLLSVAFYFTYRKPEVSAASGAACCPPARAKGITLKKVNKGMLWVVTAFVLVFAFFPNYVGYLLGGEDTLAAREDLDKVVIEIDGMTCEACAANIVDSLRKVPGVEAAEVSYERHEALVGIQKGSEPPRELILAAVANAGNYQGRFAEQVQWTLDIQGMTCEGCASGLQAALSKVPGATSASVSYQEGRARIAAGSSVTDEILRGAVSEAGYTVTSVEKK